MKHLQDRTMSQTLEKHSYMRTHLDTPFVDKLFYIIQYVWMILSQNTGGNSSIFFFFSVNAENKDIILSEMRDNFLKGEFMFKDMVILP